MLGNTVHISDKARGVLSGKSQLASKWIFLNSGIEHLHMKTTKQKYLSAEYQVEIYGGRLA